MTDLLASFCIQYNCLSLIHQLPLHQVESVQMKSKKVRRKFQKPKIRRKFEGPPKRRAKIQSPKASSSSSKRSSLSGSSSQKDPQQFISEFLGKALIKNSHRQEKQGWFVQEYTNRTVGGGVNRQSGAYTERARGEKSPALNNSKSGVNSWMAADFKPQPHNGFSKVPLIKIPNRNQFSFYPEQYNQIFGKVPVNANQSRQYQPPQMQPMDYRTPINRSLFQNHPPVSQFRPNEQPQYTSRTDGPNLLSEDASALYSPVRIDSGRNTSYSGLSPDSFRGSRSRKKGQRPLYEPRALPKKQMEGEVEGKLMRPTDSTGNGLTELDDEIKGYMSIVSQVPQAIELKGKKF